MYVIVAYDTATERNPQILKALRRWLHWTQRSVFEGELTEAQLRRMKTDVRKAIDPAVDVVLCYEISGPEAVTRSELGRGAPAPSDML